MRRSRQYLTAATAVANGGIIGYPTESVYGLGCDPFNFEAVSRLLTIKRRPEHKGLILLAADINAVEPLLGELTPKQQQHLKETWPGPVTWLLPDPMGLIPDWIKGSFDDVAVRVSAYRPCRELARRCGGLLVSTSANHSQCEPLKTYQGVIQQFALELDAVVCGKVEGRSRPSEIRSIENLKVIRK